MAISDYGVKGILHKAIADTPQSDMIANLARREDSQLPAGSSEKLDFIGMVPAMREWIGKRSSTKPIEYNYSVVLKKWENTVFLPLDWINNDKTGKVSEASSGLAKRYNQWPAALVAGLINVGESTNAFDGQFFFDTDHVWGKSGTLSNDLTFNATDHTNPTAYEAAQALVKAVNQFMAFKDDQGEPLNEDMTEVTVLVAGGTALAAALNLAIVNSSIDTGAGVVVNPVKGLSVAIKFIASTRITLTDRFVVVNSSPNACPFVFFENKADYGVTGKGAGSDFEHDADGWEYGIKSNGAAGYGRFTDAVLMTLN